MPLIIPDKIPIAYYRGKVLDSEYRFKSHMRVLERIKEVVENIVIRKTSSVY